VNKTRSRLVVASLTVALALTATGCMDKFNEPFKDAPRSGSDNGQPMDVIRMSDGFSNVGSKCDGPNRVYVIYHGNGRYGSVAVVANDPRCAR
jgi:hypothetical protein